MTSEARLTDAGRAAGIAERINNSAYSYYGATITETSGDGGATKGLKRLFAAALLSSTSVMAFGIHAASGQAACVQDGSPTSYTCSGDQGDTSALIIGDGLTVTADDSFSIETTGEASAVGINAGIRVTGDGSTITNYGSVITGVTPSHYTYGRHDAISVIGVTGTSRIENKEGGYASTTSEQSFALYAISGEVAQTVNAGTVVTTGENSDALVSRGGSSALAENSGSITAGGRSANGLIATATNGTAEANNLEGGTVTVSGESAAGLYALGTTANATSDGTIYVTGNYSTGIALNGDTVTGTNNGLIEVSGDYSTAMFGSSYGLATTNLTNNSTITVTSEYSVGIVGGGPTVNITNAEDATISSGASGVAVVASGATSGTISNAGTITGDVNSGGGRRIRVKARATSGMTVENTGTINGAIDFAYATGTTVNNIGGTVGDGETAIAVGYGENTVTISGEGNEIDGTISARGTRIVMGFVPLDIDMEPEPDSTLNFRQTDTLVLNSGYSGRAIENFQTVNFFDGVTEFYGVDIFNSAGAPDVNMTGDGGVQQMSMEASGTQVNVYNGATAHVSGGYVRFDAHTVNVTGNSEAPAAEQVATLSVAADSEIHVTGDVTFGALGRFTVGVDEPYAVEDRNVQLKKRVRTNGFLSSSTLTFADGSQIYADVTRGIELTDGNEIQIADAHDGISDYGVSVYDNTTLFDFTHEIRSGDLGDQLYLIVERVLTASQATDNNNGRTNAKSIADAIDRFIENAPADNPIVIYLARFPVEEQEAQLYKLVQDSLPSESGSDGSSTIVSTDMVLDLVMDRLSGGGFAVVDSGTGQTGVSAGDMALGGVGNVALWGRIGGSMAEYTPDNVNGFDSDTFAASIGVDDLIVPSQKATLVKAANDEVLRVEKQYLEGAITNGERYNKVIAIWSDVTERVADAMFKEMEGLDDAGGDFNAVYIMADSGARGSKQQIRQLAGMRGLMAKPSGEIIETPITSNFREGLTVLQYFISTHGARKGLADTALKTADSGYLTRRLVDVAQDVIISEIDCGTLDGIESRAIVESGEIIEPLRDRIVGRVTLEDIRDPYSSDLLASASEVINEELASVIEDAGVEKVKIRSVLTCAALRGVCAKCYGRDLGTGELAELGLAVGVVAAQSIGEPGTQLTMRTFHIGGTASRVSAQSTLEGKHAGTARFNGIQWVKAKDDSLVVMNRTGSLVVQDAKGRDRERYPVVYGAHLRVADGQEVEPGQTLVEWDPYTFSIITEKAGVVKFKDITEGVTVHEEVDEVTGLSRLIIVDSPDEKKQPMVEIRNADGKLDRKYNMPSHAHLMVTDGQTITAGEVLAKIPRETTKTKDITGGLPRVQELFEARKPRETAVISEIDGLVKIGSIVKGMRKVIIVPDEDGAEPREYSLPRGVHVNVQDGDRVQAGEQLMDGPSNPHDILSVLGEKALQGYLVNEIQEVYRLQGVTINDKHIEVIARQMMRWVKIEEVGTTDFLIDEQVDRFRFLRENERVIADPDGRPATGRPMLLGITKASLSTDSFISAASFQETTRVLTEASISGKVDHLRGLKENVTMGRLIPAGTGFDYYRHVSIPPDEPPPPPLPTAEELELEREMDYLVEPEAVLSPDRATE